VLELKQGKKDNFVDSTNQQRFVLGLTRETQSPW